MRIFKYLRVHLISTRDAKCVLCARKIQVNSGDSVPRSLPVHAPTQLAHVGPPLHLGQAGPAAESAWGALSVIGGVVPGSREVGGAAQTAALTATVEAFSGGRRKRAATCRARWRLRHGSWPRARMWRRNRLLEKNLPWSLGRGPVAAPPRRPERCRSRSGRANLHAAAVALGE